MQVVTAGARRTLPDGLEPADQALLVPAFEHAHWDMLTEPPDEIWRAVARYARIMAKDLEALAGRIGIDQHDTVLLHTANLVDVFAASEWLGRLAPSARPEIRLLFHFVPAQEAQWLRQTEEQVRQTYHVALAMLTGAPLALFYRFDANEALRLAERRKSRGKKAAKTEPAQEPGQ